MKETELQRLKRENAELKEELELAKLRAENEKLRDEIWRLNHTKSKVCTYGWTAGFVSKAITIDIDEDGRVIWDRKIYCDAKSELTNTYFHWEPVVSSWHCL